MKRKTSYLILLVGVLLFGAAYYRSYSRAVEGEVSTLFISDSYELSGQWIEEAAKTAGMNRYMNASYAGCGFATDLDGEIKNFTDLLESTGGEDLVTTIRWIVVLGGTNDQYYSEEQIHQGMKSFTEKAKELFPNSQVIIGMDGWNANDEDASNILQTTAAVYRSTAEENGAWYLEGVEDVLKDHPEYFMEDGFHPNEDGGKKLGEYVGSYVKTINGNRLKTAAKEKFIGLGMNIGALLLIFAGTYGYGLWKKQKRRAKVKLIEK